MHDNKLRTPRHNPKPRSEPVRGNDGFWWWEELGMAGRNNYWLGDETDEDEVPDEHPTFDPGPPIRAFAR